jgi:hypothetical protein
LTKFILLNFLAYNFYFAKLQSPTTATLDRGESVWRYVAAVYGRGCCLVDSVNISQYRLGFPIWNKKLHMGFVSAGHYINILGTWEAALNQRKCH